MTTDNDAQAAALAEALAPSIAATVQAQVDEQLKALNKTMSDRLDGIAANRQPYERPVLPRFELIPGVGVAGIPGLSTGQDEPALAVEIGQVHDVPLAGPVCDGERWLSAVQAGDVGGVR